MKYKLEDERYTLMDGGDEIAPAISQVAIAFSMDAISKGMDVIHKHGNLDLVKDWVENAMQGYSKAGLEDEAASLRMVVGRFDLDELNHVINTTGYIDTFLKKHGITIERPEETPLLSPR